MEFLAIATDVVVDFRYVISQAPNKAYFRHSHEVVKPIYPQTLQLEASDITAKKVQHHSCVQIIVDS